jgi:N-acyl amino acid synthase of PEP-CTERM/exosortase system
MMTVDFIDVFNTYFDMVPAENQALRDEVYRLRYQVYCLETGFESADNHPDELEKDDFDDNSEHFLILHKRSGEYAATTRLILPDSNDSARPFPIESYCIIDRADLVDAVPRNQLAEVSRFCVSKGFKRRHGEAGTTTGVNPDTQVRFTPDEQRTLPHITLALIACLVRMNRRHGFTHWLAVMEPALIRFLAHIGIHFTPIGPLVDYHGKRQPCMIEVDSLLSGVKAKDHSIWAFLTNRGCFWDM